MLDPTTDRRPAARRIPNARGRGDVLRAELTSYAFAKLRSYGICEKAELPSKNLLLWVVRASC